MKVASGPIVAAPVSPMLISKPSGLQRNPDAVAAMLAAAGVTLQASATTSTTTTTTTTATTSALAASPSARARSDTTGKRADPIYLRVMFVGGSRTVAVTGETTVEEVTPV
jgi:hypothetical protein